MEKDKTKVISAQSLICCVWNKKRTNRGVFFLGGGGGFPKQEKRADLVTAGMNTLWRTMNYVVYFQGKFPDTSSNRRSS